MSARRFAGAGLSRRSARAHDALGDLRSSLGAHLLHWWEVPASGSAFITLNGSNVAQLNDRVGGAHMVQATAGAQPLYVANGGPGDQPHVNFQDAGRALSAVISVAAANRAGLYAVQRSTAATQVAARIRNAGNVTDPYWTAANFHARLLFTGGAQDVAVTVPAKDTGWHLHAFRPIASGALSQIDGVTTTPNFTGADTQEELTEASMGAAGASGGDIAAMFVVADPTDAIDAIVRAYVAREYAL